MNYNLLIKGLKPIIMRKFTPYKAIFIISASLISFIVENIIANINFLINIKKVK